VYTPQHFIEEEEANYIIVTIDIRNIFLLYQNPTPFKTLLIEEKFHNHFYFSWWGSFTRMPQRFERIGIFTSFFFSCLIITTEQDTKIPLKLE